MTGAVQLWYYRIELSGGMPSWSQFVSGAAQMVHQRFGHPMMDTPLGELKLLGCTGSVEEYGEALSCCDPELAESQLVQLYTVGLQNP